MLQKNAQELNIPTTETRSANNVYVLTMKRDVVKYLNHATESPTPTRCIKTINKGNYATWPGLTSHLMRKHLPKSLATIKYHLQQTRSILRSNQRANLNDSNPELIPREMTTQSPVEIVQENVITVKWMKASGKYVWTKQEDFPKN